MMHWVGMKGKKKMVTIDIMGGCLVDRTCKHVYGTKILLRESRSWVGNIICTLFFWLLDFAATPITVVGISTV